MASGMRTGAGYVMGFAGAMFGTEGALGECMAHPLRWFTPGTVYEVTTRTIQERFLLRPGRVARELVLGVVARGLLLYQDVSLYAFAFLSNHFHMMASATDGAQLSAFIGYVNSNVAREMGRIHKWRGPFWGRRARATPIVDDESLVARLRYILSQGVKEGLVERPEEWPGATSTPWLLGESLQGVWIDRDVERRARRRNNMTDPSDYTATYDVRMSPLPCWSDLDRDQISERTRMLVEDIVAEARANRTAPVLGADRVLAQDPHASPSDPASSPAPLCHAATSTARRAFRAAYRAFKSAFFAAATAVRARLAAGAMSVIAPASDVLPFPPGSFPCPARYIRPDRTFVPPWLQEPYVNPRAPAALVT